MVLAGEVGKSEAKLDKVEDIHVGFHEGVALGGGESCRVFVGVENNAGKLGVEGDERVVGDGAGDKG